MASISAPATGIKGLVKHWKYDMISGFLVFLIALPLCLGISKASGFPAISGVYTAIIGGVIVTFFSGGHLTIKGPAAGLIIIALGAIEELGQGDHFLGYKLTLAAIVISGVIQVAFGFLKTGKLGDFFPFSVIHGMLAAIGVIIIMKQFPVLLGVVDNTDELKVLFDHLIHFELTQKEKITLAQEVINPEVAFIGVVSLAILFLLPLVQNKIVKMIPPPLVVILVAIPLGIFFDFGNTHVYTFGHMHWILDPGHDLVALPDNFFDAIEHPDWSRIYSFTSIKYIIMFSLVGSIESLLSTKAVDILDPFKRKANLDKDLIAVGIGNILAGMVGGLPMISEIVRSSANINNGGVTQWSNFFHGLFLFLFILLAASLIHMIPNAALAAMLIFTGYRLASPEEFRKTYLIGFEQLVLFLSTLIVTLMTDLLLGVAFGILLKIIIHIANGATLKNLFKFNYSLKKEDDMNVIKVTGAAVFSNYIPFKQILETIPKNEKVAIDFKETSLVDHTFIEHLNHLENDYLEQGGALQLKGFDMHHYLSDHPLAARKKIKNPMVEMPLANYSKRQELLLSFAEKYNFEFLPKPQTSMIKMNLAPFSVSRKIQFVENVMVGQVRNCDFFFADVQVQEGALMSQKRYKQTLLYASNIKAQIPDFTLEKEGFSEFLQGMPGYRDIDFDDYPVFSSRYFLAGESEQEIREFFTGELIEFFEGETDIFIETRNNNLLVFGHEDKLQTVKHYMEDLLYLKRLTAIVTKEAKEKSQ